MASNRLFSNLPPANPPPNLLGRILTRVTEERAWKAWRFKIAALVAGFVASAAALAFAVSVAFVSLTNSGVPQFLKLAITDTGAVAAYWQDFAYSLLETMPAGGLAAVLASIAVALILLRALIGAARVAHRRPQTLTS